MTPPASLVRSPPFLIALTLILTATAAAQEGLPHSTGFIDVPPGGDLQAALDQAQPGDTIRLAAGATYTGWFTLPAKTGTGDILIRTTAPDSALPPAGTRINPSSFPALARINAAAGGSVITTDPGAHNYRFLGLEIAPTAGAFLYNVVTLGAAETSVNQQPHNITFERCYIHGDAVAGSRRGIAMNGVNIGVYDSIFTDFKEVGADSQALAGWNGAGPFTIVNNELEGAGENLIFGGADPQVPGLVPADIVVRHNHFFKPLSWKVDDPGYAGTHWSVKNLFELKNARRVLIEGNVFENDWTDAQTATAILFTVRNQDGTAPWSQIDHVTFRNNIVRHTGSGLSVLGYDNNFPSQQTNNVSIENNLLYDLNGTTWGGFGAFVLMLNGTADVAIDHNTVFQSQHVVIADSLPNSGFVFTNNVAPHNLYGVFGSGRGSGNDSLNTYFPGSVFRRNVIPGAPAASYPVDNFYPATLNDVGFADLPRGDYRLAPSSSYKSAGTDGKDVGADIDAVEAATCGAVDGVPCSAPNPGSPLLSLPLIAIGAAVAVILAAIAVGIAIGRRRRRK
ncbi:MAG: hypothetical protein E6K08_03295 [Methanobacteriota archaeon]|nr:MAG: hypothetical protein E6K08_03295 [Euryarchaeota archaeon]